MPDLWTRRFWASAPFLIAVVLGVTTVVARPALQIDETRYLTVAWEMYASGNYLVPHLNGETYAHKPPLLFWLINLVWWITGPQDWSARLVAPAMALISVWLTRRIAKQLFPNQSIVAEIAPWIHGTMLLWLVYAPTTMFDATQTVFIQLTLLGFWNIHRGNNRWDFLACGIPLGLAILAKGPVALVHAVPAALLVYFWSGERTNYLRFLSRVVASVIVAAWVGLSWALPAAHFGGDAYGRELLWGQTAGRMVQSFAHQRPFWFYLPMLPVCLMPWLFYGGFWRSIRIKQTEAGFRFVLGAALGSLLFMSLVSGKQPYYLIQDLPMYALTIACIVAANLHDVTRRHCLVTGVGTIAMGLAPLVLVRLPYERANVIGSVLPLWVTFWVVAFGAALLVPKRLSLINSIRSHAVVSSALMVALLLGLSDRYFKGYDLEPISTEVKRLMDDKIPIAWYGNYHGQLGFAGRLTKPVSKLNSADEVLAWIAENPNGRMIIRTDASAGKQAHKIVSDFGRKVEFECPLRRGLNHSTLSVISLNGDRMASRPMAGTAGAQ